MISRIVASVYFLFKFHPHNNLKNHQILLFDHLGKRALLSCIMPSDTFQSQIPAVCYKYVHSSSLVHAVHMHRENNHTAYAIRSAQKELIYIFKVFDLFTRLIDYPLILQGTHFYNNCIAGEIDVFPG